jgi:hypothetical protein
MKLENKYRLKKPKEEKNTIEMNSVSWGGEQ